MSAALTARTELLPTRARLIATLLGASVAGAATTVMPWVIAAPAAILAAVFFVRSATVRVAAVVFGGLVALQSSQELSPLKLVYLVVVVAAVGVSALRWSRNRSRHDLLAPLLVWSLMFMLMMLISLGTAAANRVGLESWVRDAAPYLLLAVTPVLVADYSTSVGPRWLGFLFLAAGVLNAASYSVYWLEKRALTDLDLSKFVLPTFALGAGLFALASAAIVQARVSPIQRVSVAGIAGLLGALMLINGTRSSLLILAAPIAVVLLGDVGSTHRRAARFITYGALAVALSLVGANTIAAATEADVARAVDRLSSALRLFDDPVAYQSFDERLEQSVRAWRAFEIAPLIGTGPGHEIVYLDVAGLPHSTFTPDTPLSYLYKFGVLGLVLLAALVVIVVRLVARLIAAGRGWLRADIALAAYGAIWLVNLPLGLPFEDKGFALALLLLLPLAINQRSSADGQTTL